MVCVDSEFSTMEEVQELDLGEQWNLEMEKVEEVKAGEYLPSGDKSGNPSLC